MNVRFIIAGVVGFLISFLSGFVAHGILLRGEYATIANLMRPEADAINYLPHMVLSHLFKGFAFAWVYQQGISGRSWLAQGIRYGFAMIFLITVPLYLVYFAVQPMPGMLVAMQIIADSISTVLMAVVVAFICRPASSASA